MQIDVREIDDENHENHHDSDSSIDEYFANNKKDDDEDEQEEDRNEKDRNDLADEEENFNYWCDIIAANDYAIVKDNVLLPVDNDLPFPGNNDQTIGDFMRDMFDFCKMFTLTKVFYGEILNSLTICFGHQVLLQNI